MVGAPALADLCQALQIPQHPREQRRHRLGRLLGELGDLAWQRLVLGRRRFLDRCRLRLGQRVQLVDRSEEHTSELQSLMRLSYAVFCLKTKTTHNENTNT